MGLLSRAVGKTVTTVSEKTSPVLDEMGKALVDRIRRLPPRKTSPYTALSLMKAYGSFQAGICFLLRNGVYTSYASVGLGVETISVPEKKIFSRENAGKNFFEYSAPAELEIKNLDPACKVWGFPLDRELPWGAVLILGSGVPSFNPEVIDLIVERIRDIINPQIDKIIVRNSQNENGETAFQAEDSSPEAVIIRYQKMNPSFNCIVIDAPEYSEAVEKDGFHQKIAQMTRLFGISSTLPRGRGMVLLPAAMDCDLIAHRLSSSLKTKILTAVGADSPDKVLSEIRPYL